MNKNKLLSIGELAKISGVNPKSLRYYDRLGILPPAFVDPESGYRYYAFYQKEQVIAIQTCVELGIPLKQFTDFTGNDETGFEYGNLIAYSRELLSNKIKDLQLRLERLQEWQTEITRAEMVYAQTTPQMYMFPKINLWIVPYDGVKNCDASQKLMKEILLRMQRYGLRQGYSNGLLLMRQNNQWKQFVFVDVDIHTTKEELAKYPEIICIPSGQYLCQRVNHSDISKVWDWCLPHVNEDEIQLIAESELFLGNYSFEAPVLEQICLLK